MGEYNNKLDVRGSGGARIDGRNGIPASGGLNRRVISSNLSFGDAAQSMQARRRPGAAVEGPRPSMPHVGVLRDISLWE